MERRSFLKAVGGATGGLALGVQAVPGADAPPAEGERVAGVPRRVLGATGQKIGRASCRERVYHPV